MSKKHLSIKPYNLRENVWLYEDNGGLSVYVQFESGKTEEMLIPVSKIRGYIKRKDEPNN